jgi:hypothetical protein
MSAAQSETAPVPSDSPVTRTAPPGCRSRQKSLAPVPAGCPGRIFDIPGRSQRSQEAHVHDRFEDAAGQGRFQPLDAGPDLIGEPLLDARNAREIEIRAGQGDDQHEGQAQLQASFQHLDGNPALNHAPPLSKTLANDPAFQPYNHGRKSGHESMER